MSEIKQERWRELCEMAVVEPDPQRVAELFKEIDQLLSEDDDRPQAQERPGSDILQADAA